MTRLIRGAGLVIIAAVLAGCGSNAAGSSGPDRVVTDVSPEPVIFTVTWPELLEARGLRTFVTCGKVLTRSTA